MKDFDRKVW